MIDINKEAEEYRLLWVLKKELVSINDIFIAGHNSKATKAKIIQAQIDVYNDLLRQSENHKAAICKYMIKQVETLQQQLKQL